MVSSEPGSAATQFRRDEGETFAPRLRGWGADDQHRVTPWLRQLQVGKWQLAIRGILTYFVVGNYY